MIKVEKLLESKGQDIWSAEPDGTVLEAVELMNEKGIGALAVLLDGALIGILSERDCAREVILESRSAKETKVKEIMTRQVFYTSPDQNVEECLAVMTKHHIRHLPVIENDKIVGMISMGDVVKEILVVQQDKIEHLERCISWGESY